MTSSVIEEETGMIIGRCEEYKKKSQNLVKKARKITYEMMINNNELFLKAPKEQEVQKVVCQASKR